MKNEARFLKKFIIFISHLQRMPSIIKPNKLVENLCLDSECFLNKQLFISKFDIFSDVILEVFSQQSANHFTLKQK